MTADRLNYVKIPNGQGGRAEQVRLCYVLAGKPYTDVFHAFSDAASAVTGKNPFKQFPFVETASGETVYQTLAIVHHVGRGTPVWPSDPTQLTRALEVGMGAYDLYQWFGSFSADDVAAKLRFEQRRAPQFISAFGEIYGKTPYVLGETPCFADVMVHQAVGWCVRRNEVSRSLFEANAPLVAFRERFEKIPQVAAFLERQAAARAVDNAV
jgi:glutathione S-transferase